MSWRKKQKKSTNFIRPLYHMQMLLEIQDLMLQFNSHGKPVIEKINFEVEPGEVVALIGESGSGKTLLSLAAMGLLHKSLRHVKGSVFFQGQDLLNLKTALLNQIRGNDIAMIFQDPFGALTPVFSIKNQFDRILKKLPGRLNREIRTQVMLEALNQVNLKNGASILEMYPYQLSGGMLQRVMIAIAMAVRPKLLIADEPTTALDAQNRLEILQLLHSLVKAENMAMVLVSHDLNLVQSMSDRCYVMYAGRIVEQGSKKSIFEGARHPYTRALLATQFGTKLHYKKKKLFSIQGNLPSVEEKHDGCLFYNRCLESEERCLDYVGMKKSGSEYYCIH